MKPHWIKHRLFIGVLLSAFACFYERVVIKSELKYLSTNPLAKDDIIVSIILESLILLTIFVVGVIVIWKGSPIYQQKKAKKEEEEQRKRAEFFNEYFKTERENERKKIEKYNEEIRKQEEIHGKPDKRLELNNCDINSHIIVWGEKKIVSIEGKMYSFSDILDCSLVDDVTIHKGDIEYKSEVRDRMWNENYSAKEIIETTVSRNNDYTVHNIVVYINVNDFANPTIKIYMGSDMGTAKDIVNLMNIVKSRT